VFKKLLSGAVIVAIGFGPVAAGAACFNQPEWVSAHVRMLQTELMVAALQCKDVPGRDFTPQYNAFVGKYGSYLRMNAERLKGYFQRHYGGGSTRQMDLYITKIANDVSEQSMRSLSYCDESVGLFQNTLQVDPKEFELFSVDRIVDKNAIGDFCSGPRVITASDTPKPAQKKATGKVKVSSTAD
jgi:hypothetical protein